MANASWSSGLCGCFDDVGGCCLTFFCPCVTFGRIAAIVDKGETSCCQSGTGYLLLMSAGWQENGAATAAPQMNPGMTR